MVGVMLCAPCTVGIIFSGQSDRIHVLVTEGKL